MGDIILVVLIIVAARWLYRFWYVGAEMREEELRKEREREYAIEREHERVRTKERIIRGLYERTEWEIDRIVGGERDYHD